MYMRWNYSSNNRCLFFRRLKINHESHEFILESGTVANSTALTVHTSSPGGSPRWTDPTVCTSSPGGPPRCTAPTVRTSSPGGPPRCTAPTVRPSSPGGPPRCTAPTSDCPYVSCQGSS
jgi:hypothetical protein